MSPRPDVSGARREQILDAAEKVFARKGMSQARIDDIVDEAGLSKGALYWYYKSKDAIILALLDRIFTGEMRDVEALVDERSPAAERLRRFLRVVLREMARFKHLMPLGYEFLALAARSKLVREAVRGYYHRYHGLIAAIVQQGIDAGEFAASDPDQTALHLLALGEGLALLWFVAPDWVDLEGMGDAPMDSLLEGLLRRE